jgi:UDP-N-acetylmuramyl pentapeptide phosphotransferase/UDP-N-acetylglucosamine-1-phosphate transferase
MLLVIIGIARVGLKLFKKWKILDRPGNDLKNTRKPVPTLQGIFVYVITLVVLAIFHQEFFASPLVQGFLVG